MPNVQLPVVIGSNTAEALICTTIPLPIPAFEIIEIRKTVIVDSCKAIPNKVIIDGRLRKNIAFKTLVTGAVPPAPGVLTGCSGVVNTATGGINHVTVDIAFNVFIPVEGTQAGDICEVIQAVVEGENEEPMGTTAAGTFDTLLDKSVLSLCVKTVRMTVLALPETPVVNVCPPVASTGTPVSGPGQFVSGRTRPGPVPGTAVGPTLSFAGPFAPPSPRPGPVAGTIGTQVQEAD